MSFSATMRRDKLILNKPKEKEIFMAIDKKDVNGRADEMENAWEDGAPNVEFKGQTLVALKAQRTIIATKEGEIADEKASTKNKENSLIEDYTVLNSMMVDVRSGVAGH